MAGSRDERSSPADCFDISAMQLVMLYRTLRPDKETLDRLGLQPGVGVHFGDWVHVLTGPLDTCTLQRAWQHVVDVHPLLRSSFTWDDLERPRQVVHDRGPALLVLHDWRHRAGTDRGLLLSELLEQQRAQPFSLDRLPLARLVAVRLDEETSWLILATHLLLMDAWSVTAVVDDVLAGYDAIQAGRTPVLRPRYPYHEYVAQLGELDIDRAEAFWRAELNGFTDPTDLHQDEDDVAAEILLDKVGAQIRVSPPVTAALRATAEYNGLDLETMVLGAWAVLVSRYTGKADVVVGVDFHGRSHGQADVYRMLGPLRNQLPLRVLVDENEQALRWLRDVRDRWRRVREYEHVPQALIREWSDVPRTDDLFWHILSFRDARPLPPVAAVGGLHLARHRMVERRPEALAVSVEDAGPELVAWAGYCSGLFEPGLVQQMLGHFERLLSGFASMPEQPLRSISMLTAAERGRLVRDWNATAAAYPKDQCVHWLFARQAAATPEAVAIVHGAERVRYADLSRRASRWANRLRGLGVGTETLVAVRLDRSPELIAALLGVLQAGAAYVPVDPAHPADRLSVVVEDTGASVLITDHAPPAGLPCAVVFPGGPGGHGGPPCTEPKNSSGCSGNLAYILYTSGSTGRPKGVAITHRSAVDMLCWARDTFAGDLACALAATSVCFDCSILEIFGPLCQGGTVVLADSALEIADVAGTEGVRFLHAAPSVMAELLRTDRLPASVRTVMLGGEALWPSLIDAVYRAGSVERLINVYGPTECTSYSTASEVATTRLGAPSIGRPVANTAVYLLDRYANLVPPGVEGELYIGGEGVARGYLGAPGLTAERFLPDPFSGVPGARMYRTGDLARYRMGGELLFLGRADAQVKVRGCRVEPGEVEQALLRHPVVAEAAVVARRAANANHALTAYTVARGSASLTPGDLSAHLRRMLPHYMVPDVYVILDSLPRTPNGKLDRRALPDPGPAEPSRRSYVPPRTPVEATLAGLWSELLGIEPIGIDDGFFELGGDSFLAIRMVSRARKAGLELRPADVFEHQTLAELAVVAADRAGPGADLPATVPGLSLATGERGQR
jgi:amino acid adenylation domain-containing protein